MEQFQFKGTPNLEVHCVCTDEECEENLGAGSLGLGDELSGWLRPFEEG